MMLVFAVSRPSVRCCTSVALTAPHPGGSESTSGVIDLKVHLQNLNFPIRCGPAGSNAEAQTWIEMRNRIFMVVAKQLLSKAGKFEFNCQEKSLTIRDVPERAGLISKVTLMLDHPPVIINQ